MVEHSDLKKKENAKVRTQEKKVPDPGKAAKKRHLLKSEEKDDHWGKGTAEVVQGAKGVETGKTGREKTNPGKKPVGGGPWTGSGRNSRGGRALDECGRKKKGWRETQRSRVLKKKWQKILGEKALRPSRCEKKREMTFPIWMVGGGR